VAPRGAEGTGRRRAHVLAGDLGQVPLVRLEGSLPDDVRPGLRRSGRGDRTDEHGGHGDCG
jgi:hypothetical protein